MWSVWLMFDGAAFAPIPGVDGILGQVGVGVEWDCQASAFYEDRPADPGRRT